MGEMRPDGLKKDAIVRKTPHKDINIKEKHYFCNEFGECHPQT